MTTEVEVLRAEVEHLERYGDPAFYVTLTDQYKKAAERAKAETVDWMRIAQEANKRAASEESAARALRAKLAKLEEPK